MNLFENFQKLQDILKNIDRIEDLGKYYEPSQKADILKILKSIIYKVNFMSNSFNNINNLFYDEEISFYNSYLSNIDTILESEKNYIFDIFNYDSNIKYSLSFINIDSNLFNFSCSIYKGKIYISSGTIENGFDSSNVKVRLSLQKSDSSSIGEFDKVLSIKNEKNYFSQNYKDFLNSYSEVSADIKSNGSSNQNIYFISNLDETKDVDFAIDKDFSKVQNQSKKSIKSGEYLDIKNFFTSGYNFDYVFFNISGQISDIFAGITGYNIQNSKFRASKIIIFDKGDKILQLNIYQTLQSMLSDISIKEKTLCYVKDTSNSGVSDPKDWSFYLCIKNNGDDPKSIIANFQMLSYNDLVEFKFLKENIYKLDKDIYLNNNSKDIVGVSNIFDTIVDKSKDFKNANIYNILKDRNLLSTLSPGKIVDEILAFGLDYYFIGEAQSNVNQRVVEFKFAENDNSSNSISGIGLNKPYCLSIYAINLTNISNPVFTIEDPYVTGSNFSKMGFEKYTTYSGIALHRAGIKISSSGGNCKVQLKFASGFSDKYIVGVSLKQGEFSDDKQVLGSHVQNRNIFNAVNNVFSELSLLDPNNINLSNSFIKLDDSSNNIVSPNKKYSLYKLNTGDTNINISGSPKENDFIILSFPVWDKDSKYIVNFASNKELKKEKYHRSIVQFKYQNSTWSEFYIANSINVTSDNNIIDNFSTKDANTKKEQGSFLLDIEGVFNSSIVKRIQPLKFVNTSDRTQAEAFNELIDVNNIPINISSCGTIKFKDNNKDYNLYYNTFNEIQFIYNTLNDEYLIRKYSTDTSTWSALVNINKSVKSVLIKDLSIGLPIINKTSTETNHYTNINKKYLLTTESGGTKADVVEIPINNGYVLNDVVVFEFMQNISNIDWKFKLRLDGTNDTIETYDYATYKNSILIYTFIDNTKGFKKEIVNKVPPGGGDFVALNEKSTYTNASSWTKKTALDEIGTNNFRAGFYYGSIAYTDNGTAKKIFYKASKDVQFLYFYGDNKYGIRYYQNSKWSAIEYLSDNSGSIPHEVPFWNYNKGIAVGGNGDENTLVLKGKEFFTQDYVYMLNKVLATDKTITIDELNEDYFVSQKSTTLEYLFYFPKTVIKTAVLSSTTQDSDGNNKNTIQFKNTSDAVVLEFGAQFKPYSGRAIPQVFSNLKVLNNYGNKTIVRANLKLGLTSNYGHYDEITLTRTGTNNLALNTINFGVSIRQFKGSVDTTTQSLFAQGILDILTIDTSSLSDDDTIVPSSKLVKRLIDNLSSSKIYIILNSTSGEDTHILENKKTYAFKVISGGTVSDKLTLPSNPSNGDYFIVWFSGWDEDVSWITQGGKIKNAQTNSLTMTKSSYNGRFMQIEYNGTGSYWEIEDIFNHDLYAKATDLTSNINTLNGHITQLQNHKIGIRENAILINNNNSTEETHNLSANRVYKVSIGDSISNADILKLPTTSLKSGDYEKIIFGSFGNNSEWKINYNGSTGIFTENNYKNKEAIFVYNGTQWVKYDYYQALTSDSAEFKNLQNLAGHGVVFVDEIATTNRNSGQVDTYFMGKLSNGEHTVSIINLDGTFGLYNIIRASGKIVKTKLSDLENGMIAYDKQYSAIKRYDGSTFHLEKINILKYDGSWDNSRPVSLKRDNIRAGQLLYRNNRVFICKSTGTNQEPGEDAHWEGIGDVIHTSYHSSQRYHLNEFLVYNKKLYINKSSSTNVAPEGDANSPKFWQEVEIGGGGSAVTILDKLGGEDDTNVYSAKLTKTEIEKRVAKDGSKVLSDKNFTKADKDKVNALPTPVNTILKQGDLTREFDKASTTKPFSQAGGFDLDQKIIANTNNIATNTLHIDNLTPKHPSEKNYKTFNRDWDGAFTTHKIPNNIYTNDVTYQALNTVTINNSEKIVSEFLNSYWYDNSKKSTIKHMFYFKKSEVDTATFLNSKITFKKGSTTLFAIDTALKQGSSAGAVNIRNVDSGTYEDTLIVWFENLITVTNINSDNGIQYTFEDISSGLSYDKFSWSMRQYSGDVNTKAYKFHGKQIVSGGASLSNTFDSANISTTDGYTQEAILKATSFNYFLASGDRTSQIDVFSETSFSGDHSPSDWFDGQFRSARKYFSGASNVGKSLIFDLDKSGAGNTYRLHGFMMYQSNRVSHGNFECYATNDSTKVKDSSGAIVSGTSGWDKVSLSQRLTDREFFGIDTQKYYRYYKLVGVSGSYSTSPWILGFRFFAFK